MTGNKLDKTTGTFSFTGAFGCYLMKIRVSTR